MLILCVNEVNKTEEISLPLQKISDNNSVTGLGTYIVPHTRGGRWEYT